MDQKFISGTQSQLLTFPNYKLAECASFRKEKMISVIANNILRKFLNILVNRTNRSSQILFNLFQAHAPFLYPLKTLENFSFSDFFRGFRNEKFRSS